MCVCVCGLQVAKQELFTAFKREDLGHWLKKPIEQNQFSLPQWLDYTIEKNDNSIDEEGKEEKEENQVILMAQYLHITQLLACTIDLQLVEFYLLKLFSNILLLLLKFYSNLIHLLHVTAMGVTHEIVCSVDISLE